MKNTLRILFFITILTAHMFVSFADRGIGKKKTKVVLNIKTSNNFTSSLNFNLRNGMKYTGSITTNTVSVPTTKINTLITYQKGNSVYILPIKQKLIVADVRKGYSGTKLIIKLH
ncbi:MAG: hypothetical protein LH615_00190 [Ferruginibacter sp.]|nr:hypothetical protein [Ferruginibacter sp.]